LSTALKNSIITSVKTKQVDRRIVEALERGIKVREKLQQDEGGSFSAEEASGLLGLPLHKLLERYRESSLIGWEDSEKSIRFPVWQFDENKVMDGLEWVLKELHYAPIPFDDYGRMLFFLENVSYLGQKRVLDCLRAQDMMAVQLAVDGAINAR
jgi:hypothetical protein